MSNETIPSLREQAIQWWGGLQESTKQIFFMGYRSFTPAREHGELTGSEIQNIWAVKTNTEPREVALQNAK